MTGTSWQRWPQWIGDRVREVVELLGAGESIRTAEALNRMIAHLDDRRALVADPATAVD